ncbi:hypothetical protein AAE478_008290 [Parahypoxylon ruwenzoriense]
MTVTADDIALLVQKHFDALPAKRKPVVRGNGLREWVPLSGIVAQRKGDTLTCLSLATGMKCLPASKIPHAHGNVLHDWHAEVLAIRAFNRFVLDECKAMLQDAGYVSEFLRRRRTEDEIAGDAPRGDEEGEETGGGSWHGQLLTWRDDVLLHMYCSDAPCGDASMELIMAAQEDATPWDDLPATTPPASTPVTTTTTTSSSSPPSSSSSTALAALPGRAFFSRLGHIRRKPSRADAPATLSKSCSDKLALRQCVSLLGAPAALLVDPAHVYLRSLVLPGSRYSAVACRRAFSAAAPSPSPTTSTTTPSSASTESEGAGGGGRMHPLLPSTPTTSTPTSSSSSSKKGGYTFHPFTISTTTSEFTFSRTPSNPKTTPTSTSTTISSNISTCWTHSGRQETTLGGVLQGRKQSGADARGASLASRRRLWGVAAEMAGLLPEAEANGSGSSSSSVRRALLGAKSYGEMKDCALLEPRRRAKEEAREKALKGWVRNTGDEYFTL